MWENPALDSRYYETYRAAEWQQSEWSDASTELYALPLRGYDPILGRFHSPDPYQQFHSPYLANFNNPANFVDPSGGWGECFWEAAEAFFKNTKGAVGTDGFATGLAIVQTGMVAINAVMNIGGMHKDLAKSVDELAGEMAMATTGNPTITPVSAAGQILSTNGNGSVSSSPNLVQSEVDPNLTLLQELVTEFGSEMDRSFTLSIGETYEWVNENGQRSRRPKGTLLEKGFQIVQNTEGKKRITETGISNATDGTIMIDKPKDLSVNEQVMVDFHTHPDDVGDAKFAWASPASPEDIFNLGYASGATISIVQNERERWALVVTDVELFKKWQESETNLINLRNKIKSKLKWNKPEPGQSVNDIAAQAIIEYFQENKVGLSLYKTSNASKTDFKILNP